MPLTNQFSATAIVPPVTYFVDNVYGDDALSGLSPGLAWKTIGRVNAGSFAPGDVVSFKRGTILPERLILPASGVAGAHFIINAYGFGANPIIDGEDARWCISGNGKSFVTIDGVDVKRSSNPGIYFDGTYSNITIRNLSATDCAGHGIFFDESPSGLVTITGVTSTGNTRSGLRIYDAEDGGYIADSTFASNSDHGIEASNCIGFLVERILSHSNSDGSGLGGDEFSYCTIQDSEFYDNRYGGVDLTGQAEACEYNIVRRNIFHSHTTLVYSGAVHMWTNGTAGHFSQYNEVYNNLFYGNNCAVFFGGQAQNNERG